MKVVRTQDQIRFRFGAFELDPALLELRKNGDPVKLREQVCRILLLLLERPDEVVTREELRKRLWTEDTFVDFDKSLNTAINTLREAIGDNAGSPIYIQTVPRRGYRFIAPIEVNGSLAREPVVPSSERRSVARLSIILLGLIILSAAWLGRRVLLSRSAEPTSHVFPLAGYTGILRSPLLSPDGSQVAFTWLPERANHAGIYVQTVGAAQPSRLTDSPSDDVGPSWSPDGTNIAFLRVTSEPGLFDFTFDVMLIPPTGGAARKLTSIHYPLGYLIYQQELLAWMPNGKWLLFPDAASTDRTAIWRISVETGQREQLTFPESPIIGHSLPSVRPDGAMLVYQRVGGPCFSALLISPLSSTGRPEGEPKLIACEHNVAPSAGSGKICYFPTAHSDPRFTDDGPRQGGFLISTCRMSTRWLRELRRRPEALPATAAV